MKRIIAFLLAGAMMLGITVNPDSDFIIEVEASTTWAFPVNNAQNLLGCRFNCRCTVHSQNGHNGVDFRANRGAAVFASAAGTVTRTFVSCPNDNNSLTSCNRCACGGFNGNLVTIDHGSGFTTSYLHLASVSVRVGQTVTRGQQIGTVGSTGRSTGPHLHFTMRQNGAAIDPLHHLGNSAPATSVTIPDIVTSLQVSHESGRVGALITPTATINRYGTGNARPHRIEWEIWLDDSGLMGTPSVTGDFFSVGDSARPSGVTGTYAHNPVRVNHSGVYQVRAVVFTRPYGQPTGAERRIDGNWIRVEVAPPSSIVNAPTQESFLQNPVMVSGNSAAGGNTYIHLRNLDTDQRVNLGSGAANRHFISSAVNWSFTLPILTPARYRLAIEFRENNVSSWEEVYFTVTATPTTTPPLQTSQSPTLETLQATANGAIITANGRLLRYGEGNEVVDRVRFAVRKDGSNDFKFVERQIQVFREGHNSSDGRFSVTFDLAQEFPTMDLNGIWIVRAQVHTHPYGWAEAPTNTQVAVSVTSTAATSGTRAPVHDTSVSEVGNGTGTPPFDTTAFSTATIIETTTPTSIISCEDCGRDIINCSCVLVTTALLTTTATLNTTVTTPPTEVSFITTTLTNCEICGRLPNRCICELTDTSPPTTTTSQTTTTRAVTTTAFIGCEDCGKADCICIAITTTRPTQNNQSDDNDQGERTTATTPISTAAPPMQSRELGDVDGDGEITIADALEILKFLAGISTLSGDSLAAARITGGDEPTIADALEILKYLAGISNAIDKRMY
jgi:hypothetical protein